MCRVFSQVLLGIFLTIYVERGFGREIGKCELASELLKNGIPRDQLPNWICIATFESSLKTDALNPINTDGSKDHGIFQINDRYWCSPGGANVCGIECNNLRNDDITDDIRCAKQIFQVHGYSAWVVYPKNCANKDLSHYISGCKL